MYDRLANIFVASFIVSATLPACGSGAHSGTADSSPVLDTAQSDTHTSLADSGAVTDSGSVTDSGAVADSGAATDSGSVADSGAVTDSGAVADSRNDTGIVGDSVADSVPSDTGSETHTGAWKFMLLGDSITGSTCYPQDFSYDLTKNGRTNFTFIGTVTNNQGGCTTGAPATVKTEGHGGYKVTYLVDNTNAAAGQGTFTELQTWAAEKPDVVDMEIGTNDCWNSYSTASILSAYGTVVDQFRLQNPNVIFFVAQITPLNPTGCTNCEANVEALNAAIPGWATGKATAASPIYVVNVWASLNPATYLPNSTLTTDGVHPLNPAAQPMADAWYTGVTAHGLP